MDLEMPIMGGIEAAKEILKLQNEGHIPGPPPVIVAISGHCEQSFKIRTKEAGMVEFVEKPAQKDVLAEVLKKYCKK
jgi:CheY-like chemotaxis protein